MNVDFVDVNMVCDVALKINSETTHVNDEVMLKIELLKKKSLLCFCLKKIGMSYRLTCESWSWIIPHDKKRESHRVGCWIDSSIKLPHHAQNENWMEREQARCTQHYPRCRKYEHGMCQRLHDPWS
jgi:hypothetical protein